MRIIAGEFKKSKLFSVEGKRARPTSDFMKEVIFNVLFECEGQNVLDLYAGSGALGLEAISRGAESAVFVEFSDRAIATIKKNIDKLKCNSQTKVYKKRVSSYLNWNKVKFDLIFLDPPYDKNLVNKTIKKILEKEILKKDGKIIAEHSIREKIYPKFAELIEFNKKTRSNQISILSEREL